MNINKLKILIKTNKLMKPAYELTLKPRLIKQRYLFNKYGLELLSIFQKTMQSIDITYWLEFGTLLGAYRERDFIKYDSDIDIGLFLNNDSKKIQKALICSGFKLIQQITIDNGKYGMEQTYSYKGVTIDLFFFIKKDSEIYCHVFKEEDGQIWEETIEKKGGLIVQEHTFPYDGFTTLEFKGIILNIPSNIEEHLEANYGETFMTPNQTWCYTKANNIKILNNKIGIVERY